MAPNKPSAMAGPWWEAECLQATPGAVPNWASCSALFSVLIQGPDNPCLAPSPTVKRLTGGQETLVPLPPSAPASREPCGEVAVAALRWQDTLQLGQGHAHTACLIHHHLRET